MKQILASLLAAYTLTNGQTTAPPAAGTTAAANPAPPADLTSLLNPATPAPVTPAPVIPIVITPAPVTPAPITPAPVTPAPTTAAPTTPAPTYNPHCPMPAALATQHGVQSGTIMSSNAGCLSPQEIARDFNGILQCSQFACCQCAEIRCGDPFGLACDELVISDSGAVGNQNINVLGDMTSAMGGNSFAGIGGGFNNGAEIRCNGLESCKASRITGKYVGQLSCSGDMGCAGANIYLEDPGEQLQVQCNGMMSCMNTNLEIVITPNSQVFELGTIEFNGQQSAQGMTITITNQGYNAVMLQNLECMNPTACPNLRIQINGNIFIENCDMQHMNPQTAGASLLAACQAGNNFQGNFLPQQQFPPAYVPPPVNQVPPTNPGGFNQPPVTQQPPATQQPPVTGQQPPVSQPQPPAYNPNPVPVIPFDPSVLTCEFGQCRNRAIRMSPAHNFQLKCQQMGQCDGLQLTLDVGAAAPYGGFGWGGSQIDSLTFSAPTNGATITINGYAEVNDIRCEVAGACRNLRIIGANIDVWNMNMDCQTFGSCAGCTVNGQSCEILAMQQGNNGGFSGSYYPQYGYPQYQQPAPQFPGQQQWV